MSKRRILLVSDEQRAEWHQAMLSNPTSYLRERTAALLKIAAGQTPHAVALGGLYHPRDPDTVYAWLDRYQAQGLSGLIIRPGRGRKPAFAGVYATTTEAHDALLHVVRRDPRALRESRSRWTLAALQRVCSWLGRISRPGVSQVLTRLHVSYTRGRESLRSPDPDDLATLLTIQMRVREARHRPSPRIVVLFQDEVTDVRHPTVAQAYAASGHDQARAPTQPCQRHHPADRRHAGCLFRTGRVSTGQRHSSPNLDRLLRTGLRGVCR